jgi:hypothetical protein
VIPLVLKYHALETVLFLRGGGARRLRRMLRDTVDVRLGMRVLELRCGAGLVSELPVERGPRWSEAVRSGGFLRALEPSPSVRECSTVHSMATRQPPDCVSLLSAVPSADARRSSCSPLRDVTIAV